MPKVAGKVIKAKVENDKLLAIVQFNGKMPKAGDLVIVKWGKTRSLAQNALYWLYLTFLFEDCRLKEEYLTVDELHETFKATFLSRKTFCKNGFEMTRVKSTTSLDKLGFTEYIDKIDKTMTEYQKIDTRAFWKEYMDMYRS